MSIAAARDNAAKINAMDSACEVDGVVAVVGVDVVGDIATPELPLDRQNVGFHLGDSAKRLSLTC
jgi:hypothetical protein